MNKEKIEKMALLSLVILGLVYVYNTYLFSPKWEATQKVKGQLIERQQYYQQLVSYQQNRFDLEKSIESISIEAEDLSAQIPPRLDNPQIMVDIYTSAKLYGVDPITLQFEQLQNKGSYEAVGMTFACKGNVDEVLNLISDFQNTALQKLSVQSVTLTAEKASTIINTNPAAETIVITAQIKLTAYASALGTANVNGPNPSFMSAQFGVNSTAEMFTR